MNPQVLQAILQSLQGMKQTIAAVEQLIVQGAAQQPQPFQPAQPQPQQWQQPFPPQQFQPQPQQQQWVAQPPQQPRPIQPAPDFGGQYLNQSEEAALDVAMGVGDPDVAARAAAMRQRFMETAMQQNPNALRSGGFVP